MSKSSGLTLLSELAKVFEDVVSDVRGKHYVRVEGIDPIHALQIVPLLTEMLNKFDAEPDGHKLASDGNELKEKPLGF